jgi:hypothetical protein
MAWVPLQEWQPGFEPNLDTISAGSADFVDSTIVFTGATNRSSGTFAYGFWYAYNIGGFIAGETVRIRVECTRAEWGTYTAPSPPNVRLVGSSSADLQTVWAGGVPATFDIELVNTADSQGQVDLWMQWGSGSGGTLFTGGNFEFRISVWREDPLPPDPEPVGCFWTDLVNVTQECGDGPPPVVDAIAVWPWYSDAWDDVFWNPDVTPVELPELTERQTRTFALGDLLDGYGDVTDYCNNVVSGVKFDGSRMYTDPLEQGRNGCTGYFYGVSVALTPKADALYTMHAQDGGAFYPELFGHPYRATAKAHVNMTGEFRLLGVTSNVNVYAGLVQVVYGGFGTGALVFTGTPTGAWTPIEDSGTWSDLFNEGEIFQFKVSFGANSMTSYPEATFALDMEFEVVAERQARVAAKVVNLQQWDEDPDMEGFGLPEEPGDPVPGVIYIIEDVEPEPSVYVKLTPSGTGFSGLIVGDLVTVDPYTGEELENHGKIKFQPPGGGG